ncbi:hypothetical protein Btru_006567 [Bulinus truncatus]|nr:hypothetical protein Btru_006567 [Bulinus truncatus]
MNFCWVLFCLLPLCACKPSDVVVRDASDPRPDKVFDLISETLGKATAGIPTSDLVEAAKEVKSLADNLVGEVSAQDVNKLIKEISETVGTTTAISEILEDNMTYNSELLNDFLAIWTKLVEKGRAQKESGSNDLVFAAISKVSGAIRSVVGNIVDVVKFNNANTGIQDKDVVVLYENKEEYKDPETGKPRQRRRVTVRCGWWARCNING